MKKQTDDRFTIFRDEIAFWELLFEQSRDGIVIITTKGAVYEANNQFADMIGYSASEVNKLHVWDWDAVYDKAALLEMLETVDALGDHFVTKHLRKDGSQYDVEISTSGTTYQGHKLILCICRDITERLQIERERETLVNKLQKALSEIQTLEGIIPICAGCKKIRDDTGYWSQVEAYVSKHTQARFSHGLCPECTKKYYPDMR
jgi:PAS domain S-box-containing protein